MKKLAAVILFLGVMSGCVPNPAVPGANTAGPLTFTPPTLKSVQVGTAYTTSLTASGGTLPYTWSVTSGSLPAGLKLNSATGVISGTPTAAGSVTFTITVTDSSTTKQTSSAALTLNITPPPLSVVTSALSAAVVNQSYGVTLQASGGTPPYTFSIATGLSLPNGLTLTSAGVLSGTPAATGTASFSITVTDTSSPQQSMTVPLSLKVVAMAACGTGNEAILSGQYAFELGGYNGTGFEAVVGSFTANGTGGITAGEADMNDGAGAQTGMITTASSFYSVGSDNRGCATIATPFGTFTTRFSLGTLSTSSTPTVATRGQIIDYETPSGSAFIGSGIIAQQTTGSFAGGINATYDYLLTGYDSGVPGRIACAGVISGAPTAGSGGNFRNGEQDCNDDGTLTHTTAGTGIYSKIDANGRLTAVVGTAHLVFYMLSTAELFEISTDANPVMAGWVAEQTVATDSFTAASLNGNAVFYTNGVNNSTSGSVEIGIASSTGNGSVSISAFLDQGGAFTGTNPTATTCTATVYAEGRVTNSGAACGNNPPILYLTGPGAGFVLGTSAGAPAGQLFPQTVTGNVTAGSQAGNYFFGTTGIVSHSSWAVVGVVSVTSGGAINIISDSSSTSEQIGEMVGTDTFMPDADGTFSLGSSNGQIVGIAIGNNQFLLIVNASQPYPLVVLGAQ